jgi:hypothetical protein
MHKLICALATVVATCGLAAPAMADGVGGGGLGTPSVVSVGDSAISGEAGRWAGNTNNSSNNVDALGSTAYWDTPTGEAIPGCHRSKANVLEMSQILNGRRLCESTVGLLEEKGLANWTVSGAADQTEWVSQIRTTSTIFGPYQLQEGLHPSYWGQKAMRNCVRQAYNGGTPRGGTCTHGTGLNGNGEPNATLT